MGQKLAVLGCSGCGAPLALGREDWAVCGQCGRRTVIPAEHRALRDAGGWDAQARAEAEAALHGFDRPPGLLLRVVAVLAGLPFAAVFVVFGVPLFFVDLALAIAAARLVSQVMGWPSGGIDEMSPMLVTACMGVVLWGLTIVPAFLAAYGGRRVTARSLLLEALAARPPAHAGGPASCRACGAPLAVEAQAVVARCVYCGAENALQVAPSRLKAARASTETVVRTMREAGERDRDERRRTRQAVVRRLRRVTVKTAIGFGLWAVAMYDFSRVEGSEDAPGLGILALVLLTFFLIYLIGSSGGGSREDEA